MIVVTSTDIAGNTRPVAIASTEDEAVELYTGYLATLDPDADDLAIDFAEIWEVAPGTQRLIRTVI